MYTLILESLESCLRDLNYLPLLYQIIWDLSLFSRKIRLLLTSPPTEKKYPKVEAHPFWNFAAYVAKCPYGQIIAQVCDFCSWCFFPLLLSIWIDDVHLPGRILKPSEFRVAGSFFFWRHKILNRLLDFQVLILLTRISRFIEFWKIERNVE